VGALDGRQGGPTSDELDEDTGVLFAEPVEHLREILLERIGHAIDETAAILDQSPWMAHVANQRTATIVIGTHRNFPLTSPPSGIFLSAWLLFDCVDY